MRKAEKLGTIAGSVMASIVLAACSGSSQGGETPQEYDSQLEVKQPYVMTYVFQTSPQQIKSSNRTCAFIDMPAGTFKRCMTAASIADFKSSHDPNWYGGDFKKAGSVLISACYFDENNNAVLMTAESDNMWDTNDAYKIYHDRVNTRLVRDETVLDGDTPCVRRFNATEGLFYIVAEENDDTRLPKPEFVATEDWQTAK